jgi:hypothetical protein
MPSPFECSVDAACIQRSTPSCATPSSRHVSTRSGHRCPVAYGVHAPHGSAIRSGPDTAMGVPAAIWRTSGAAKRELRRRLPHAHGCVASSRARRSTRSTSPTTIVNQVAVPSLGGRANRDRCGGRGCVGGQACSDRARHVHPRPVAETQPDPADTSGRGLSGIGRERASPDVAAGHGGSKPITGHGANQRISLVTTRGRRRSAAGPPRGPERPASRRSPATPRARPAPRGSAGRPASA